jgi:hypothetical protein
MVANAPKMPRQYRSTKIIFNCRRQNGLYPQQRSITRDSEKLPPLLSNSPLQPDLSSGLYIHKDLEINSR